MRGRRGGSGGGRRRNRSSESWCTSRGGDNIARLWRLQLSSLQRQKILFQLIQPSVLHNILIQLMAAACGGIGCACEARREGEKQMKQERQERSRASGAARTAITMMMARRGGGALQGSAFGMLVKEFAVGFYR